jgi:hypothetical protein
MLIAWCDVQQDAERGEIFAMASRDVLLEILLHDGRV